MSKDTLVVGDSVFNSPAGTGTVTGITQAGYPQVNDIAVGRMVHKTEDGQFLVFDPNNTYSKGDWEMFIDDERYPSESVSKSVVIVRSSQEAIAFCKAAGSLPKNIMFDHDLGGNDTSMKFIHWMTGVIFDDPSDFSLRQDFQFSVHSQNPIGAANIKSYMSNLIKEVK